MTVRSGTGYLSGGNAAFANSYCIEEAFGGWRTAVTTHGVPFVSALERGTTVACQFHPELSGPYGLDLIRRWLEGTPGHPPSPGPHHSGLLPRMIPCLDVRDGRVVKGIRFQQLRDVGDPAESARAYERQGADEIVVLDVAASPEAQNTRIDTVRDVRAQLHIPLTVGGGVRSVTDAARLLDAGADKVAVNTAAVRDPTLIAELAARFGCQCIVLAIDARRTNEEWEVLVNGGRDGTGRDAVAWARTGVDLGAGEILLTSWDRDGTGDGCDLALLTAVSNAVRAPVIASGGIGTTDHVRDALRAGADAVLAASIYHDGVHSVAAVKDHLTVSGIAVREAP